MRRLLCAAADQRQQRRPLTGRGIGDDGDQRLDTVGRGERAGTTASYHCGCWNAVERLRMRAPARGGLRPIALPARRGSRPRGERPAPEFLNRCRQDCRQHLQPASSLTPPPAPPWAGRRSCRDRSRRDGSRSGGRTARSRFTHLPSRSSFCITCLAKNDRAADAAAASACGRNGDAACHWRGAGSARAGCRR